MSLCARSFVASLCAVCSLVAAAGLPAFAGPTLLLEAASGRVLYADEQDNQWFPASLTKMMTAYLTFDALKKGRLKLTDPVPVSEKAHVQPPSKIGLPVGSEISVDIAIRALVVKSANDVAIMLAEKVGGTEEDFVRLMNDTAKRLGMTRTHFVNPNGLPVAGQVSTARDLATLARAVLRDFPEHNALWGMSEFHLGKLRLRSHNGLLRSFEGADGIKTGFICDSGFNVVASATRDGLRLIAVVLGEPSGKDRNARAASLLEHGFETASWKAAFGAPSLDRLPIDPAARPVQSVRSSVTAWNCNGKKPVRKARRKPRRPTARGGAKTPHAAQGRQSAGRKATAATTQPAPAKSAQQPSK
ncbi:MAG: D-alanyl-D-alanine carboxypeptidase family protein [Hyphomicrobiaceae bacterium]